MINVRVEIENLSHICDNFNFDIDIQFVTGGDDYGLEWESYQKVEQISFNPKDGVKGISEAAQRLEEIAKLGVIDTDFDLASEVVDALREKLDGKVRRAQQVAGLVKDYQDGKPYIEPLKIDSICNEAMSLFTKTVPLLSSVSSGSSGNPEKVFAKIPVDFG
ncbi:hypothetical protein HNO53_13005 [Billgrantia antri]|uniref:Uncharacterized protein n=1 Tax=Halomonas sulfidivorans TaxID=2733488 RepID=A0ABX7WH46_9GAMM|nr:hypothetical protein [Halomonas sulfidivorans]QTP59554.1 hypothetical protein HNO53_13005 [Halomonas sulfidivorans]